VETNGKNTNLFSGRAWTPKCTTKDKYRNQSMKKGVELILFDNLPNPKALITI
jgi:hypothetical protein